METKWQQGSKVSNFCLCPGLTQARGLTGLIRIKKKQVLSCASSGITQGFEEIVLSPELSPSVTFTRLNFAQPNPLNPKE